MSNYFSAALIIIQRYSIKVNFVIPFNEIEEIRFKGFSKTLSQIEWLLAAIVTFYLTAVKPEDSICLWGATALYSLYIILFHYTKWTISDHKIRLIAMTVVMIFYITFVVWFTGKIDSPMVSLYYLVLVVVSITLNPLVAAIEVFFITIICLVMAYFVDVSENITAFNTSLSLIQLFPFWLVTYLTSMLAKEVFTVKKKLEWLSQTDSLTGLWNMRMFSLMAERELLRASRTKKSFAIVMLDADNLKFVNDSRGHQAGNKLIQHMAEVIKLSLRETDLAARFGGDEFVLLLIETEPSYAYMVAERIRTTLEKTPLTVDGRDAIAVTMSLGLASFPLHAGNIQDAMRMADKAMYKSKKSGKNRTTVYSE